MSNIQSKKNILLRSPSHIMMSMFFSDQKQYSSNQIADCQFGWSSVRELSPNQSHHTHHVLCAGEIKTCKLIEERRLL